ncbi:MULTISPECIES: D-galactarate dehydratase [Thioclava]|uniref:D-galactarate dehydratase n=1 Tax=Thioclava TaxID=285107 RepID=UPI000C3BF973|nr:MULTISPECIES: D-galactarate dehydratase [Thioclava]MAQ35996.1 D-galactarate dehydratase [Thioclava sp.]
MRKPLSRPILALTLMMPMAGCATLGLNGPNASGPATTAAPDAAAPVATPVPKPSAKTADSFDTTTAEQRAEAAKKPVGGETKLGTTIASLGDPADPGFWVKTGLVKSETPGRIEDPKTGKSAKVTLIPSGKAAGSGSEVSLPALRLLEVPLTDLPELTVYKL